MGKTYFYQKELTVTTNEGVFELPRLRNFSVVVNGDYPAQVEFDNDITADSAEFQIGVPYSFSSNFNTIHYKGVGGSTTIQIIGEKHEKTEN